LLELQAPSGSGWDSRWAKTGNDGRFSAHNCVGSAYSVSVFEPDAKGASLARVDGILADSPETIIRVHDSLRPTAFVVGVVLDSSGEPVSGASISARRKADEPAPIQLSETSSGRFKLGPIPPGLYVVDVSARGYAGVSIGPRAIEPRETWDLGQIRLTAPGTLVVHLTRSDKARLGTVWAFCRMIGVGGHQHLDIGEDAAARSSALGPGRYELHVDGLDIVSAKRDFEIRAGETTSLDVVLQVGLEVRIRFSDPAGLALAERLHARVLDASNNVVGEADLSRHRAFPIEWALGLQPGAYRVEAASPDGTRTASAPLTLSANRSQAAQIEIALR
jgi:hypothetical protein